MINGPKQDEQRETEALAKKILIGFFLGAAVGLLIRFMPERFHLHEIFTNGLFDVGGSIFVNLMKMLIGPLILVSLLCGICSINNMSKLGKIGGMAVIMFVVTTAIAVTISVCISTFLHIGANANLPVSDIVQHTPGLSMKQFVINMFPNNPFQSLAECNILQIVIFSILLASAINLVGKAGERIAQIFQDLQQVVLKTAAIIMSLTPYGVFCLIAVLFAKLGFGMILQLLTYIVTVIAILILFTFLFYGALLQFVVKISPIKFFNDMKSALLLAFSTASSNVALPVTMDVVKNKLKVDDAIASFVLSLGINMNKNGTAIMQGVATVFIANAYHVKLHLVENLSIILTATVASISSAGAPSIGVLTLVMVLRQVGLPVEGIMSILAVDRIIDMVRTPVNIAGNAVIACILDKYERIKKSRRTRSF